MILEEQNFKNEGFELVLGFLELALNLIRFRDVNDLISWTVPGCELGTGMREASTLDSAHYHLP